MSMASTAALVTPALERSLATLNLFPKRGMLFWPLPLTLPPLATAAVDMPAQARHLRIIFCPHQMDDAGSVRYVPGSALSRHVVGFFFPRT